MTKERIYCTACRGEATVHVWSQKAKGEERALVRTSRHKPPERRVPNGSKEDAPDVEEDLIGQESVQRLLTSMDPPP